MSKSFIPGKGLSMGICTGNGCGTAT